MMTGVGCGVPIMLLNQAGVLTLALASHFLIWWASLHGGGLLCSSGID